MALSPGVKRQEREAGYSSLSIAEVKNGGAYIHSSIRLHDLMLNLVQEVLYMLMY
jgi:hypothetical protein